MSKPHFSKLKNPLFKLKTHKTAALLFRVGSFSRAGGANPMKIVADDVFAGGEVDSSIFFWMVLNRYFQLNVMQLRPNIKYSAIRDRLTNTPGPGAL